MMDIDEYRGRSRRHSVEDRRWSTIGQVLGDRTIRRSVAVVCGLHYTYKDEEREFLNWASKLRSTIYQWFSLIITGRFVSGLASKPLVQFIGGLGSKLLGRFLPAWPKKMVAIVSHSLTSKPVAWVSRFEPQNRPLRFGDLILKITVMVAWFEPQNQVGFDLSVAPKMMEWVRCWTHVEM
jgi:hypothetical protein